MGARRWGHLRLPSKLAWLGAVQEGGKPSLGTVDPASLGFFGLCEGSQGFPLQPQYIHHPGLRLQTGLPG